MTKLNKYWILTLISTLLISTYPIYMGISVIYDMTVYGSVPQENFPKYIIPYTPIAIALLFAVLIMPIALKFIKKFSTLIVSALSLVVFFAAEFLFESLVFVSGKILTTLEGWQMSACYINPEWFETRTWTAVDVLMGEYSPAFKLHFYMISVVLIISIISCIYGFAKIVQSGNKEKCKPLTIQAACTAVFLDLCIFACFTAFFRDGDLIVSPLSAFLMALFFITLGVTVGTYLATFFINKRKLISIAVPSVSALLVTLAMYIGETFLLSGHLYLLGEGFFFEPIPYIVLAPADIVIILMSGLITALICNFINKKQPT